MKRLSISLLAAVVVCVVMFVSVTAAVTEYSFDNDSQGWSCAWFGGYISPDPICSSPSISGAWDSLSAAVFVSGDINTGSVTLRFVDTASGGAVLCESFGSVGMGEQSRVDLFCGGFSGSLRLDVVEGSGGFLIDFVRLDLVPAPVPTATPILVASVPSWPSPTPAPVIVPQYPNPYPAVGSPVSAPASGDPCVIFLRLYVGAGVLADWPLDVQIVGSESLSRSVEGFGVVNIPGSLCGSTAFLTVYDGAQRVSDPVLVQLRSGASVDVGVSAVPALPAAAEPVVMVDVPPPSIVVEAVAAALAQVEAPPPVELPEELLVQPVLPEVPIDVPTQIPTEVEIFVTGQRALHESAVPAPAGLMRLDWGLLLVLAVIGFVIVFFWRKYQTLNSYAS